MFFQHRFAVYETLLERYPFAIQRVEHGPRLREKVLMHKGENVDTPSANLFRYFDVIFVQNGELFVKGTEFRFGCFQVRLKLFEQR